MAKKLRELKFSVKNKVGTLAEVTKVLKQAKVNILDIAAWSEGGKGYFNMVTSSNARAIKALRGIGVIAREGDVLALNLRNKVGSLDRVARKLAKARIDIRCLQATAGGKRVTLLMNTKSNTKARRVI